MSTLPTMDLDGDEPAGESFETAVPVRSAPTTQAVRTPAQPLNGHEQPTQLSRLADGRGPQSTEQYLLGCCLIDEGHTLAKAIAANLTSTDFADWKNGIVFGALREMHAAGTPVALDTLVEHLGQRVVDVGGITALMALDQVGTTARAQWAIEQVTAASEQRRFTRISAQISEAVAKGATAEDLQSLVARLKPASAKADPVELGKTRITLASRPTEPTTRLFLAQKPVATPGNLVSLISKAKTGKTATIGGVVAAIVGAHFDRQGIDTLGFTAPHTKEALVLIDTEQSPYDAFTCHQRAFARAAQDADVDWFHHHALVGYSAARLKATLPVIMAAAKTAHGAVFTLILDGVADFVESVNDEAECNNMITWLRAMAVDYDCPIICVIHSNEAKMSGDDGRGHLGKQLTRKAESNLLLKKTGEITVITSEKQRKAPITEADGVAFMWSDETHRHVSCEPSDLPERPKGGRPKACTFEMLETIWPKNAEKALTMPQLLLYAKAEEGASDSTLRRIIKEAVQTGQLVKIAGPIGPKYHLPA